MANVVEIGQFHELTVAELVDSGILLNADGQDLFLPAHLAPEGVAVGDSVEVFLYADHEGLAQATTWEPAAVVGEFAYLKCVSVTGAGAYLDWGVPKDLYVPPDHQGTAMLEGKRYVVAVCMDRKGERIIGSTRLSKYFDYDVSEVRADHVVALLVYGRSDAGVQVVVDGRHRGLIHSSDVYQDMPVGSEHRGYVRLVREDNRLDVVLTRRGVDGMEDAQAVIVAALEKAGGMLALHDRSSPEAIQRALGLSKKAFKRAIGGLYKADRIVLGEGEIRLA